MKKLKNKFLYIGARCNGKSNWTLYHYLRKEYKLKIDYDTFTAILNGAYEEQCNNKKEH